MPAMPHMRSYRAGRRVRWLLALAAMFAIGLALAFALDRSGALGGQANPPVGAESGQAYLDRGIFLIQRGEYQRALEELDRAIQSDEQLDLAYYQRGRAHFLLGDHERAIEDYTQALAHSFNDIKLYIDRGAALEAIKSYGAAEADYTAYLAKSPRAFTVYRYRGIVRTYQGNYQQAIADFDIVLAAHPEDAMTINSRGIARFNMGDEQGALEDYTRAAQLLPRFEVFSNLGETYSARKEYQKAKENFDQAIRLNPTYVSAYRGRAVSEWYLGDRAASLADYRRAADLYRQQGDMQWQPCCWWWF
jgi:tetratricopeptide (TPR) repeat protein